MVAVVSKTGRLLKKAMPAKKPVPTDTYSKRVSARVRAMRDAKGWTVAELAERINKALDKPLANSTIHGWDNGSGKIDPDCYPLLAKVFGVPLLELLPPK